jgi:hypothetical protein
MVSALISLLIYIIIVCIVAAIVSWALGLIPGMPYIVQQLVWAIAAIVILLHIFQNLRSFGVR